jgi:hypothetical protein
VTLAMRRAFAHFADFPGKALKFIADGYSVYKLARLQFQMQDTDFDVTQVIGVTNGYDTFVGADSHVAVFITYYNFLRTHPFPKSSLLSFKSYLSCFS